LADDLVLQTNVMSYGGSSVSVPAAIPASNTPPAPNQLGPITVGAPKKKDCGCGCGGKSPTKCGTKPETSHGTPDFDRMSAAEKLAYNQAKRDRIFGK
jgi:hypothetical protein